VRGAEQYLQALEELLTLVPDLRLEVPKHTMSADGEFGFSRWVMQGTGARGPFELVGMDRTRVRDGLVCENYVFFDRKTETSDIGAVSGTSRFARDAVVAERTLPASARETSSRSSSSSTPTEGNELNCY
jgi:hypothetical protein